MIKTIVSNRWLLIGSIYTLLMIVYAAIINYLSWSPQNEIDPWMPIFLATWLILYIPLFIFPRWAGWNLSGFGIRLDPLVFSLSLIIVVAGLGCSAIQQNTSIQLGLIEGFARGGEELFFRGFVYQLVLKICGSKTHPRVWAVLVSSLLFALVHTQTFLPDNHTDMFNIFLLGAIFASIRALTGSVLPAMVAHAAFRGGMLGMISAVLIYMLLLAIARWRGEEVISPNIKVALK